MTPRKQVQPVNSRERLRRRTLALVIPFGVIVAGKVVTAYTMSGSRGDTALTVVVVVAAGAVALVAALSIPVSVGSLLRRRALAKRFPTSSVLTVFNVIGLVDALRKMSPEKRIPIRGYYGLVVESSGVSLWRGSITPSLVATIPAGEIQRARLLDPATSRASAVRVVLDAMRHQSSVEVPLKLVHATPVGAVSFERAEAQQFIDAINANLEPG